MFHLYYAIRTSPIPSESLQWIQRAQARLNESVEWSNDEFSLAPVDGTTVRDTQVFPFVNTARTDVDEKLAFELLEAGDKSKIPEASMVGDSKVLTLWDFHLIVAFLRVASKKFPKLFLSLADSTCHLLPVGAIEIQAGKISPYTNWLCSGYEFYVDMSGDEDSVTERAFVQAMALANGNCITDMLVQQGALRQMQAVGLSKETITGKRVSEVAMHFVRGKLADLL